MIPLGYKWIRRQDCGDAAALDLFFSLLSTDGGLLEVPGEWTRKSKQPYPLDWHIKAEAHRTDSQVVCGRKYDGDHIQQSLLETSAAAA